MSFSLWRARRRDALWRGAVWRAAAAATVALAFSTAADAQPRPTVVELFTSEGCNSCPPAEAYVGELAGRRDVLALAFHVDYWDDLGWRDRFGLSQAVERQNNYAHALRLSTVYTPQIVIDGRADYVGSNRFGIDRALRDHRDGPPMALSVGSDELSVKLEPGTQAGARGDVVLVSYLRKAVTPVGRGENAGRTLEEYNIVRSVQTLGHWEGTTQEFRTKLASLPRDATDVAVLVQAPGQGAILSAATHPVR
jgi:hypothetical protein